VKKDKMYNKKENEKLLWIKRIIQKIFVSNIINNFLKTSVLTWVCMPSLCQRNNNTE
jgi:hypothetical protein